MIQDRMDGLSNVDIGAKHGYSREMVGMILASPLAQQELARRRETLNRQANELRLGNAKDTEMILREASPQAAITMRELLTDVDSNVRFKSAKDLLDRTYGQGASTQPIIQLNADRMQILVEAIRESRSYAPPPQLGEAATVTVDGSQAVQGDSSSLLEKQEIPQ
jgi:hypothetical protein